MASSLTADHDSSAPELMQKIARMKSMMQERPQELTLTEEIQETIHKAGGLEGVKRMMESIETVGGLDKLNDLLARIEKNGGIDQMEADQTAWRMAINGFGGHDNLKSAMEFTQKADKEYGMEHVWEEYLIVYQASKQYNGINKMKRRLDLIDHIGGAKSLEKLVDLADVFGGTDHMIQYLSREIKYWNKLIENPKEQN